MIWFNGLTILMLVAVAAVITAAAIDATRPHCTRHLWTASARRGVSVCVHCREETHHG